MIDEHGAKLDDVASEALGLLEEAGLRRRLRLLEGRGDGAVVQMHGKSYVNFSSNDYLGLASSEVLKKAMLEAVEEYGVGSGASRLVCGNWLPHHELEQEIARFKQTEAALTFSSGHAVSVGVLPALCGPGDTIILDKLSHASLIDGAKLSGATIRVFPHNHVEKLERLLASARANHARGKILIVTESVFSMDGDCSPLMKIVELKERYDAWLLVDEAHAFGLLGPQGRGLAAGLNIQHKIELHMGTLSKAAGVSGGYLATSQNVVDLLINKARSLVYSTAPSPAVARTATAAVRLLAGEEGERRRQALWAARSHLLSLLPALNLEPVAAIVPLLAGDEKRAASAAAGLLEDGFFVPAIRYPTVARGAARLRVTLSALHERVQIEGLVTSLRHVLPEMWTAAASEVTPQATL